MNKDADFLSISFYEGKVVKCLDNRSGGAFFVYFFIRGKVVVLFFTEDFTYVFQ